MTATPGGVCQIANRRVDHVQVETLHPSAGAPGLHFWQRVSAC
nr:MAG TPA: hypothetical protein [Caudoviricetes sp.]